MNKLTAEKCAALITNMQGEWEESGLSTKEELYLAALEIALPILEQQERGEGEWIEWGGGNRPVPYGTMVDVRFRDGNEGMRPAGGYRWDKQGLNNDIIDYRIIPERDTNQNGEQ